MNIAQYSTVLYESHGMYMYITFLVFGSEISTAQYSTVRRIPIIQWNGGEEREQQHVSVVLYCITLYVHDQHQVTAVLTFDHNCNNNTIISHQKSIHVTTFLVLTLQFTPLHFHLHLSLTSQTSLEERSVNIVQHVQGDTVR
jgi:hypothetical protein